MNIFNRKPKGLTGQEWAERCKEIKEKNALERDPFQKTLRAARWAINYGHLMLADEKRREVIIKEGPRTSYQTKPPDEITKELWKKIGYPEKARGDL